MSDVKEVIIIGSGPAGLTAAIYAARANLKPLVLAGSQPGGQLVTTTLVDNYPGFPDGIQGPKLMQDMIKQSERFGTEFIYDAVTRVDFSRSNGGFLKVWAAGKEYSAKSVIIATGSSPRTLGLDAEKKFWGRGVSTCATCDGAFFKDKIVAVIGGGDSMAEESTFLTKFATRVYVIHRRSEFRASKIMQEKVFNNRKIEIIWDTEVRDILGDQKVEKLKIENNRSGEKKELPVDGMFLAIGHIPNTSFLKGQIELDKLGFVKVKDGTETQTSVAGVFVGGDAKDYYYQQAVTAAGMGCMAAMDVEHYLNS